MGKTWCERVGDGTGEMGWYSISQLLYTSLASGSGRGIKAAQRRTLVSDPSISIPKQAVMQKLQLSYALESAFSCSSSTRWCT